MQKNNIQDIDVLLVRPVNENIQNIIPNIGLGYVSKAIKKAGFTAKILDCAKEGFDFKKFADYISEINYKIIGFQAFSFDIISIIESINLSKEIHPDAITIIGGPHPSGDPYNLFKFIEKLDFGFMGEVEESIPLFLRKILKNDKITYSDIPGLIWKRDNKTISNCIKLPENLDAIGMPDWEEIDPLSYPLRPHGVFVRKLPLMPIIATRGCPFLCTFCAGREVSGLKLRYRSVENIVEEITYLNKKFGVKEIHIEDDNFTLKKDFVLKFCKEMKEKLKEVVWALPNGVRLDTLDTEVLTEMKNAGCYSFAVGIESGSQRILNRIKKNLTVEKIKDKVNLIHHCGIKTTGFFIIGLPDETLEDYRMTLKLALSLPLDRADFSIFIPLPGTSEYKTLINSNGFSVSMFKDFNALKVLYNFSKIKTEKIKKLQEICFFRFYFRLRIIFSILYRLKNKTHLLFLLKRIKWLLFNKH